MCARKSNKSAFFHSFPLGSSCLWNFRRRRLELAYLSGSAACSRTYYPTELFTILEPRYPSPKVSYCREIRQSPDFEALGLWNVRSGR